MTVTLTAKQQFAVKLPMYLTVKNTQVHSKERYVLKKVPLEQKHSFGMKKPQPNKTHFLNYLCLGSFLWQAHIFFIPAEFKLCLQNMS